jgi:hypothetical protein
VLLFPFGKTHTKQYGTLEFDHADAIEVMHYFAQRGVRVPWDVEHATARGGPAQWQDSHGWSVLFVDQEGLKTTVDWNRAGEAQLTGKSRVYDSPEVVLWRGNHIRAIPQLSLVTEPARNHSIPLLMSGGPLTTATPAASPRQTTLSKITGNLGALFEAFSDPAADADVKQLGEQIAGAIKDPATKLNALLQEAGGPTGSATAGAGEGEKAAPVVQMSGAQRPDPLAELGAEFMTLLGAKTPDEARGVLRAMRENQTALLSARTDHVRTLVQFGQHMGKVKLDEVADLEKQSPDYVKALLSGRAPNVNTAAAETATRSEETASGKSAADVDLEARMEAAFKSTKIGGGAK